MTGDDDAILMMLSLANNDSTKILMPQMTIDRTDYLINLPMLDNTPFLYGVPYPGNAQSTYRSLLSRPTFANLDVEVENVGESDSVRVNVSGTIEPGIMPEGEPLFLTVYLMESQVESNSQKFWEDKEGEKPAGNYTHYNVIREILTPLWGDQITTAEDGTFTMTYLTKRYDDYDPKNLSITAFINRGEENGHLERQIINSQVAEVPLPVGIHAVSDDNAVAFRNGSFYLNGEQASVFTVDGKRVSNRSLTPGVYLLKAGDRVIKRMVK